MGISLTANYRGAPSLDGSSFMLFKIRSRIAKAWDAEFGEHYATLMDAFRFNGLEAFDRRTTEILEQPRFSNDADIAEFMFMSDCDGKVNYKTCKKLADLLTSVIINKTENFAQISLRYQAYSKNDWEDLLELLNGCYSHRANLIWR